MFNMHVRSLPNFQLFACSLYIHVAVKKEARLVIKNKKTKLLIPSPTLFAEYQPPGLREGCGEVPMENGECGVKRYKIPNPTGYARYIPTCWVVLTVDFDHCKSPGQRSLTDEAATPVYILPDIKTGSKENSTSSPTNLLT